MRLVSKEHAKRRTIRSASLAAGAAIAILLAGCTGESATLSPHDRAKAKFARDFLGQASTAGSACLSQTAYNIGRIPVAFRADLVGPNPDGIITIIPFRGGNSGRSLPELHLTGLGESRPLQAQDSETLRVLRDNNCPQ